MSDSISRRRFLVATSAAAALGADLARANGVVQVRHNPTTSGATARLFAVMGPAGAMLVSTVGSPNEYAVAGGTLINEGP